MTKTRSSRTLLEFTVTTRLTNPDGELPFFSNAMKATMLEALGGRRPVIGYGHESLIVTCDVLASDAEMAVAMIKRYVDDALAACGLAPLRQTRAEVVPSDQFAAEADELMGLAEIANSCCLSRQRAHQLSQTAEFPVPRAKLAAGPVWLGRDVRHWWSLRSARVQR